MKLPVELGKNKEWTIVGPMGPALPSFLLDHPVICVDGGAKYSSRIDIWIGDGDSHSSAVESEYIFRFAPKKNLSDFSLTLAIFDPSQKLILHAWGLQGGRLDHELINYGEALHFLGKSPGSQIYFYNNKQERPALKCLAAGEWTFNHQGLFSVAALGPSQVTILGQCEYPLLKPTELSGLSSLGLSNSSSGEFKITTSAPIMVFFPGEM